jgi:hypothetical protein
MIKNIIYSIIIIFLTSCSIDDKVKSSNSLLANLLENKCAIKSVLDSRELQGDTWVGDLKCNNITKKDLSTLSSITKIEGNFDLNSSSNSLESIKDLEITGNFNLNSGNYSGSKIDVNSKLCQVNLSDNLIDKYCFTDSNIINVLHKECKESYSSIRENLNEKSWSGDLNCTLNSNLELESISGTLKVKLNDSSRLNELKSVYSLDISHNNLQNLKGLENIVILDLLNISYNDLENLSDINRDLISSITIIKDHNPRLLDRETLIPLFKKVLEDRCSIDRDDIDKNLQGFNYIGDIDCSSSGLTDGELDNFIILEQILGSLDISDNSELTNLQGLSNIKTLNGDLHIELNSNLTDLTGLSNIMYNRDMSKTDHSKLYIDEKAPHYINKVSNESSFCKLNWDLYNNTLKNIDDNKNLVCVNFLHKCKLSQSFESGFKMVSKSTGSFSGDIDCSNRDLTKEDLYNFIMLNSVSGDLILNGNNLDEIPASFNNIESISGVLDLSNNILENLDGFQSLTTSGSLLLNNNRLKEVDALKKIVRVENNIDLSYNLLEDISGLKNIAIIKDRDDNRTVEQIEEEDNTTVVNINGHLDLSHNNLTTLSGALNDFIGIGDYLDLSYNKLTSLSGLESFKSLDNWLYIDHNEELIDISSIYKLKTVKPRILIKIDGDKESNQYKIKAPHSSPFCNNLWKFLIDETIYENSTKDLLHLICQ